MNLRWKVLIAVVTTMAAFFGVLYWASRALMGEYFEALARREAVSSIARVPALLEDRQAGLDKSVLDWASWDGMYEYAQKRSAEFERENFTHDSLRNLDVNAILMVDASGRLVHSLGVEGAEGEKVGRAPPSLQALAVSGPVREVVRQKPPFIGLVATSDGTFTVSCRPITMSSGEGDPRGSLMFARRLEGERLEAVRALAQLDFDLRLMTDVAGQPEESMVLEQLGGSTTRVETQTDSLGRMVCYRLIPDAFGKPAFLVRATISSAIMDQAVIAMRHVGLALATGLVVLAFGTMLVLRITVLSRLERLADGLRDVAMRGHSSVLAEGQDEIEMVARMINAVLAALSASQQQLTESEAYFRGMADFSPLGIFYADERGDVMYVNRAFTGITSMVAEHCMGGGWFQAIHPRDREAVRVQWYEAVGDGRGFGGRFRLHRGVEDAWCSINAARIDTGDGRHCYIGTFEDVSAEEKAQSELREATRAAQLASRSKSEFLANMSHEIRTPMTAILGYADLLTDETVDAAGRAEYVATMRRNGEHLMGIINDVLDVSKIEAGRMTIESIDCDPGQIVDDIAQLFQPRAQEKGLELEVRRLTDLPASVRSDPTRLRQVVMNLVNNAVKFTQRGHVRVEVSHVPKEPAEGAEPAPAPEMLLRVAIHDTGIGMTPEQLARLFKPFSQSDSSVTRKFGGTGLGLAISRNLVEMMGGRIEVRSTAGMGTVFIVELPAVPGDGTGVARSPEAGASGGSETLNVRVLLAEDGPDNQRLISFHLRKAGATVDIADNGQVAIEKIVEARESGRPYEVIFMDMQMPELDGYSATMRLRQMGVRTPVIALTAHAMPEDRARCLEAGCDDYATKPINKTQMIDLARSWAEKSRAQAA